MPWKEIKPMDQKLQLIADWNSQNFSKTDLSKKYALSRKTVYKWILRYIKLGIDGLKDQSKEPFCKPNSTKKHIIQKIIDCKLEHPKRGPKKIFHILLKKYPDIELPAPSTIGYWLKKNNLVIERRKIKRVPPYNNHFAQCLEPNDSWSIDYKGQFYTQNKRVCYPFTISDNYSRYLLKCQCLPGPRYDETKAVLEQAFREYGIPRAIRSDNGTPFASKSVAGLSRLSIWFIQHGIIPERIEKGCPQQNGRHERMHKTLKYETLDTVAKNLKEHQERFYRFQIDYNYYRPHEALEQKTPIEFYKKSSSLYVEKTRKPFYDYDFVVRQVRQNGEIKFKGNIYFLTSLLNGHPIGLKQIDEDNWDIYFYFFPIASLNLRKNKIFSK
jgi:transposase InsO family protein